MKWTTRIGLSALWLVSLMGFVYWLHEPRLKFQDHIPVERFVPGQGYYFELLTPGGVTCPLMMPVCAASSSTNAVVTREDPKTDERWRKIMLHLGVEVLQFSPNSRTYSYVIPSHFSRGRWVRFVDSDSGTVLGEAPMSRYPSHFSGDGNWVMVDGDEPCKIGASAPNEICQLRPFERRSISWSQTSYDCEVSYHGSWVCGIGDQLLVHTRTGRKHRLPYSLSQLIFTSDESHALIREPQLRTHWLDLNTGEDQIVPVVSDDWISQLPTSSESEELFIATRTRKLPSSLKKLLGGPSSWLVSMYEQDLVDIVNPVTGDRPRWLACRGKFEAVSRDGTQLVTLDSQHRHLVWQLNRWTPGPWETTLLALVGFVAIWRGWLDLASRSRAGHLTGGP